MFEPATGFPGRQTPVGWADGKDFDNMYMTSFIQSLIATGWEVRPAFTENGWLEVDTVHDLKIYEDLARDGLLIKFYDPDR